MSLWPVGARTGGGKTTDDVVIHRLMGLRNWCWWLNSFDSEVRRGQPKDRVIRKRVRNDHSGMVVVVVLKK